MIWMLEQPPTYTANVVSMTWLRETEGIMPSRLSR
jgi:hypothetical protein